MNGLRNDGEALGPPFPQPDCKTYATALTLALGRIFRAKTDQTAALFNRDVSPMPDICAALAAALVENRR